eukprot:5512464-Ditylum_brightwellii.AAC.1
MLSSQGSDGDFSLYSGITRSISNDESSNNGSKPGIRDSAFANDNREYTEDMMKVDNEKETDFMVEEWEWNTWALHNISYEIPGPKFSDRTNGPHQLEDGVEKSSPLY